MGLIHVDYLSHLVLSFLSGFEAIFAIPTSGNKIERKHCQFSLKAKYACRINSQEDRRKAREGLLPVSSDMK